MIFSNIAGGFGMAAALPSPVLCACGLHLCVGNNFARTYKI